MVACHQEQKPVVIDVKMVPVLLIRRELVFSFFAAKKEETGLGLPIVKKIAEAVEVLEMLGASRRGSGFG